MRVIDAFGSLDFAKKARRVGRAFFASGEIPARRNPVPLSVQRDEAVRGVSDAANRNHVAGRVVVGDDAAGVEMGAIAAELNLVEPFRHGLECAVRVVAVEPKLRGVRIAFDVSPLAHAASARGGIGGLG